MMISYVFSIPEDVLIALLCQWTKMSDLAVLDLSICNHFERCKFLDLISSEYFIHNTSAESLHYKNYPNWIALRLIKVSHLRLNCSVISRVMKPTLLTYLMKNQFQTLALSLCDEKMGSFLESISANVDSIEFFSCNSLTDGLLKPILKRIKSLKSVEFRDCPLLTDKTCENLVKYHPNLTSFTMDSCDAMSDSSEIIARGCYKLQTLSQTYYYTDVETMRVLTAHCCDLTSLNIIMEQEEDGLAELFLRLLQQNTRLTNLKFDEESYYNSMWNAQIAEQCSVLTSLKISDFKPYDTFIKHLSPVCALKSIDFAGCTEMTNQDFLQIISHCVDLTDICLFGCGLIKDMSILVIARSFPNLVCLNVSDCSVTDHSISKILECCTRIKTITVDYNISEACLVGAMNCEFVSLYTDNFLDKYHCEITRHNKSLIDRSVLHGVYFSTSRIFSNRILETLAFLSPNMLELLISGYGELTNAAFQDVISCCPLLRCIEIADSPFVTVAILEYIADHCHNLVWLHLIRVFPSEGKLYDSHLKFSNKLISLVLPVRNCLTEIGLQYIINQCPNLTFLGIPSLVNISEAVKTEMKVKCPKLRHLEVERWGTFQNPM